MTITIGRAVLPDPSSFTSSGNVITLSGVMYSTDSSAADRAAEVQAREAQVLGMVNNPDEDVFPLVWTAEPKWDGFYRVLDASWDYVSDGSTRMATANYSITLEAVTDGHAPLVEISSIGIVRTNAHSLPALPPHPHPLVRRRDQPGWKISSGTSWTDAVRPTSDGYTLFQSSLSTSSIITHGHLGVPATHYPASACIEVRGTDSVWYPWVGRHLPPDVAADDIRVTNGVVRFGFTSSGTMRHELWDGSAWDSFDSSLSTVISAVSYNLDTPSTPSIVRNDLDAVVIRVEVRPTSAADYATVRGSAQVTITLQAGQLWTGLGVANLASVNNLTLRATTSTAATGITGGIRATSNAANGNRFVIATPTAFTTNLTIGSVITALSSASFMVAQSLGGSSASDRNTEALIVDDWIGTNIASTRVIAR